jgi:hypothetical protein
MPDDRSRIEKLRAMANQTVSPNEAAIAKRILEQLGDKEPQDLSWEEFLGQVADGDDNVTASPMWQKYAWVVYGDLWGTPIARHFYDPLGMGGMCVRCHHYRDHPVHMTAEEEADYVPI